jgi:hypothetical protein
MTTKVDEEDVPLLVQSCIIKEVPGDVFNITVRFFDDSYASAHVTLELLEDIGGDYESIFKEMWKRK